ncbi:phosphoribosylglycinamide formyltransferase [Rheinheimera muenzenbergensis]|uniref:Phosphoribosylglycinamide formyltransferase n=1 Tax=Rheinheimera muenzenbergensis TaxID=1193628 RepID=A0ABU8C8J0_9GAMM|nr:phosphoribosylglycinamide formyltransferase [Gammaproteobacteria bacterium]MBU1556799.1 phosphoribosylglycinamide formyltransferase [Gammaproteobacteria bacterium]MBU2072256.1 phosphoribosylglycinamide formyltransferase [Gammaproteobacteria bacterium]MBU2181876.1 phosphoribosylglycinamide formyltransferase [Gammaproteobacteria bacterium]MBU2205121.1 phosphoribosylglycinamide formyltransferase [Gammaproteobacteria bacterium]
MKSIVVLISGSGSNLQAIIDACSSGFIPGRISAVIANKANAYGLVRANEAGLSTQVLSHKTYKDREQYDIALADAIDQHQPDLVVLAGFMRILTPAFVQRYHGRLLNIHPSLLPKYQGLHTHQRAIDNNDSEHGCSVHFVTDELDGGPVVLQAKVPVFSDDDAESLAERVHEQEHRIYPLVVRWFCQNRLQQHADQARLDGQVLAANGYANDEDE